MYLFHYSLIVFLVITFKHLFKSSNHLQLGSRNYGERTYPHPVQWIPLHRMFQEPETLLHPVAGPDDDQTDHRVPHHSHPPRVRNPCSGLQRDG
jgi:hypothetical protein